MAVGTKIQWTHREGTEPASWNPIGGTTGRWTCVKISPGCDVCYAEATNIRFGGRPYEVGADLPRLKDTILNEPLNKWKKPTTAFVCSMTDLFEERVPFEWIDRIFDVIMRTPQHTYIILTKRPHRMLEWYDQCPWNSAIFENVWWGVTVELQRYMWRAKCLAMLPAKVRFISAEPMLEALCFDEVFWTATPHRTAKWPANRIHQVIFGGESHYVPLAARSCDPEWIRSGIEQCRHAGVAPFVKQLGSLWARQHGYGDKKAGNPTEWPENLQDLRVREFPDGSHLAVSESV